MGPGLATTGATVLHPEDQLVARCRMGDDEAFGQIYERYERPVYRYAYHLLGHRDDADDVKQDTFVKAHRSIRRFRGECSLQTWLLKICGNLCRDRLRSCANRLEVLSEPADLTDLRVTDNIDDDPEASAERACLMDAVLKALQGMPSAQREVIVLREVEDLSYEDIGNIVGRSQASVKLLVFRARRRFRERVAALLSVKG